MDYQELSRKFNRLQRGLQKAEMESNLIAKENKDSIPGYATVTIQEDGFRLDLGKKNELHTTNEKSIKKKVKQHFKGKRFRIMYLDLRDDEGNPDQITPKLTQAESRANMAKHMKIMNRDDLRTRTLQEIDKEQKEAQPQDNGEKQNGKKQQRIIG